MDIRHTTTTQRLLAPGHLRTVPTAEDHHAVGTFGWSGQCSYCSGARRAVYDLVFTRSIAVPDDIGCAHWTTTVMRAVCTACFEQLDYPPPTPYGRLSLAPPSRVSMS